MCGLVIGRWNWAHEALRPCMHLAHLLTHLWLCIMCTNEKAQCVQLEIALGCWILPFCPPARVLVATTSDRAGPARVRALVPLASLGTQFLQFSRSLECAILSPLAPGDAAIVSSRIYLNTWQERVKMKETLPLVYARMSNSCRASHNSIHNP